jgi:peptidoglycan-associated lipoprotein
MNRVSFSRISSIAILAAVAFTTGCSKKLAKVTPPPPPAAPAPTATLSASPDVIAAGRSTTLTWHTQDANDITITGLGTVSASGSRTVIPSASTTYDLNAKGPGGSTDASARVTVGPAPIPAASEMSLQDMFNRNVKDVYFDLDRYNLRPDDASTVTADAQFLAQHPNLDIVIAGHCDDRGSEEYNLALGANRANSLKQALIAQGVSPSRIKTISYGKEKPFCTTNDESCWQQNRRDHFAMAQ